MNQPILYLFVGYPGAGKTSVAKVISEKTGALHLWADRERLAIFGTPTHSAEATHQRSSYMNKEADQLLSEEKSVIFDTNFNFYKDREHLRQIAAKHGATTIFIWVTTPKEIAKKRAVEDRNLRNGYEFPMSDADFERIASHLQPPREDEKNIKIDGSKFDKDQVVALLSL